MKIEKLKVKPMPGRKPNYYPSNDIEEELKAFIKECRKPRKKEFKKYPVAY